jgi:hypothetical protein
MFRQLIFQHAEPAPIATQKGMKDALERIKNSEHSYFPSYETLNTILNDFIMTRREGERHYIIEYPAIFEELRKIMKAFNSVLDNYQGNLYKYDYGITRKRGVDIFNRFDEWKKDGKLDPNTTLTKDQSIEINERLHTLQTTFKTFPLQL